MATRKEIALFKAIKKNNYAAVLRALDNGADLAATDRVNYTALHIVMGNTWDSPPIDESTIQIAELLLSRDATIDARGNNQVTPLMLACERGSLEMVKLLVKNGANVDTVDKENNTPLHYIAKHVSNPDIPYPEIAEILLSHMVDINIQNHLGDTPLHTLIRFSDSNACDEAKEKMYQLISMMVDKGAIRDIKNKSNKRACDIYPVIEDEFRKLLEPPSPKHAITELHFLCRVDETEQRNTSDDDKCITPIKVTV